MKPVYLDYNATTPLDPQVTQSMLPYLNEHFGNPSSSHVFGTFTKKAVEHARIQVAEMLHCEPQEIIFTSGGSESNNLALKGVVEAYHDKGNHVITSSVEHPAVTNVCQYLETKHCQITYLPVDQYGLVKPAELEKTITPHTVLISIMHANNEVGTVEPIAEIAEIARAKGVLLHTDAAQSVGKITVRVDELKVDLLSLAGHKFYAPKGVGALYIRKGIQLNKLIHGADHEYNLRAGTENVIHLVGLGTAATLVNSNLSGYRLHMQNLRDAFESKLRETVPNIKINGHPQKRLPNTSSVSFKNQDANVLLSKLPLLAASAGAACHSGETRISTVLEAMSVPPDYARGTIRFSLGRFTSAEEIDFACNEITRVLGEG